MFAVILIFQGNINQHCITHNSSFPFLPFVSSLTLIQKLPEYYDIAVSNRKTRYTFSCKISFKQVISIAGFYILQKKKCISYPVNISVLDLFSVIMMKMMRTPKMMMMTVKRMVRMMSTLKMMTTMAVMIVNYRSSEVKLKVIRKLTISYMQILLIPISHDSRLL